MVQCCQVLRISVILICCLSLNDFANYFDWKDVFTVVIILTRCQRCSNTLLRIYSCIYHKKVILLVFHVEVKPNSNEAKIFVVESRAIFLTWQRRFWFDLASLIVERNVPYFIHECDLIFKMFITVFKVYKHELSTPLRMSFSVLQCLLSSHCQSGVLIVASCTSSI